MSQLRAFDLYFDELDGLSLRGNGCMAEGQYVWKADAEAIIESLQAELKIRNEALERLGEPRLLTETQGEATAEQWAEDELIARIEYARTKREEQPDG